MKSSLFFIIYIVTSLMESRTHSYLLTNISRLDRNYYSTTHNVTINLAVHFDETATQRAMKEYKQYHRRSLKNITRQLVEDAEKLFDRPGLNVGVSLNLLSTKFIVKSNANNQSSRTKVDALEYLNNYCRWQRKLKMKEKQLYSVLFTGYEIYQAGDDGALRTRIAGKSFKRGACTPRKNCALMEWRPRDVMANLLAHELGHSLGMSHNKGKCDMKGGILQKVISQKLTARTWTQCNSDDLKRFLKLKKSACLGVGKINA